MSTIAIESLQELWKGLVFAAVHELAPQPVPEYYWEARLYDERHTMAQRPADFFAGKAYQPAGTKKVSIYFDSYGASKMGIGPSLALSPTTVPKPEELPEGIGICGFVRWTDDGPWFVHWAIFPPSFWLLTEMVSGHMKPTEKRLETLGTGILGAVGQLVLKDNVELFAIECGDSSRRHKQQLDAEELGGISNFVHYLAHTLEEPTWWDRFCELVMGDGSSVHADSKLPCAVCGGVNHSIS